MYKKTNGDLISRDIYSIAREGGTWLVPRANPARALYDLRTKPNTPKDGRNERVRLDSLVASCIPSMVDFGSVFVCELLWPAGLVSPLFFFLFFFSGCSFRNPMPKKGRDGGEQHTMKSGHGLTHRKTRREWQLRRRGDFGPEKLASPGPSLNEHEFGFSPRLHLPPAGRAASRAEGASYNAM